MSIGEGTGIRTVNRLIPDAVAWAIAALLVVLLRYDFLVPLTVWPFALIVIAGLIAAQFAAGFVLHLYRGRYLYGSIEEVRALGLAALLVGVLMGVVLLVWMRQPAEALRTALSVTAIALVLMLVFRYVPLVFSRKSDDVPGGSRKVLVFGAGWVGQQLISRMLNETKEPVFSPVGLIDDDLKKRNLRVKGVPVLGTLAQLRAAVELSGATELIIAVGRADAALLRRVTDAGNAAGLNVLVLPELDKVLQGASRIRDLRDVSIEDLIGRQPVDTDVKSIAGYVTGKRVLVTGAGGSIGGELCRQLSQFGPDVLVMLDRDESGLQGSQLSISGHGLLDTEDVVLADIRDVESLREIFRRHRPEVVFHAAALKHLPMLEQYPEEAWKTNVLGTRNVLEAALDVDVETFVNISTDKAANPSSVLGHSKRVAEKLTVWAAKSSHRRYLSVRFGNVIGSRGSMLPMFRTLIEAGGPVTVTHPEVTRYFMTISEACQLVIQAGSIGRPGEVLILDMGEPVKILDIAQRMIAMSGEYIEIVYTGLRPGEKLHEELVGEDEVVERPFHPQIQHTSIGSISPEALDLGGWMRRLVPAEAAVSAHGREGDLPR
ncbi:nucleoside-diphosphate sugar epimerase/dehydratase [Microbacterium oxydans]|uniref:nucleoside-diphosphate sugar epimerase/dehydratase n=1 Tax=Microbacterium TaxID=33882 RepID=UPI000DE48714|nr:MULTISPECIES: nucleoside-diphosphate sugar epimerase/dehydratase [unclassified Microbacterium]MBE7953409.1 polysaccharide biosynthesis protein [Microbacterium sp. R1]NYF27175.1 dTDP-glucose 4,6-dehydratase [Microbacterium sp. JAI119]RBO73682.1 polysaccharide biosynthesis protein [Microbacterium sp. H6]